MSGRFRFRLRQLVHAFFGDLPDAPVAQFSADPLSGTTPCLVQFTDQSTGSPTSWSWDFGDSSTSTSQNPTHTYTVAGVYSVSLTATNASGESTLTKASLITVTVPAPPPDAQFSGTPLSGANPLVVTFTDASTGSPTSWSWNFGDTGTSTSQNPVHTYTADGTYSVTLIATNANGSDNLTKTGYITVATSPPPPPPPPPVAKFHVNKTTGIAPCPVQFTDDSTGSPTAWAWDFGDGQLSTAQSPLHTYAAGTFSPKLTASNAYGESIKQKTNLITVTAAPPPPPGVDFVGVPQTGSIPLTVQFNDLSTNTPTTWAWTFGDGGTSTAQNPSHQYVTEGTYSVSLTATNAGGEGTLTKTAYITATAAQAAHLTINGTNFLDENGAVWIPYGMSDGHFELWHSGDEAADAAMNSTCLRSVVRLYGTYGTGYQQDMQQEGQVADMKPAYLSGLVTRLTASRAAGMRNGVAMDSNKGQGVEASGGNDYFSGSAEGNRKWGIHKSTAVYLAQNYGDLIDWFEPLVEPNSAVVPNKEALWARQEEFMTAVLAVAPNMLFAIGPRDYAAGNIASAINTAWLVPGNAFYGHVFMTCNFLNNLSVNTATRVTRAALLATTRNSANIPAWINQLSTHPNEDLDDAHLDATMTLHDQAEGGPIGYNYWERVSVFSGSADGLYYLSNSADVNSSRLSHDARIALVSSHFAGTVVVSGDTWGALQLLAANLGPNYDFNTRIFVNANVQGRAWMSDADPYGSVSDVTLKADGYPASGQTATRVFLSDLQDAEAGVWKFECLGDMTAAGKITPVGGITLGAKTYVGATNKTTFDVTVHGSADNIIAMRFFQPPPSFGGVKLHPPGYALDTTKVIRDDAAAHLSLFDILRAMDWLETNGNSNGPNTDTDWLTSRAAKYSDVNGYPHSLKACFDLATALDLKYLWTCAPARATDDYFAGMVADGSSRRSVGTTWLVEYGNELWNGSLGNSTAYQDIRTTAFNLAKVRAGSDYIASIVKVGTTVTCTLKPGFEHTNSVGDVIWFDAGYVNGTPHYQGFDDPGTRTLIAGSSGLVLKWNESSGSATVSIQGDNTFVFLNRSHTLCRQLTSYQQPGPIHPNDVRIRYMLQRARALYNTISTAGQTANIKVMLGSWVRAVDIYVSPLLWALEEYSSLSWLYAMPPSMYMEPDNQNSGAGGINSVTDVFTKLDDNANSIILPITLGWNNLVLTLGLRPMTYEAGPHTHAGDGVSTQYIVAAHTDDRMRQRLKSWWQSWRNRGGYECNFFHAGVTTAPSGGNATWAVTYGTVADDDTSPKYQAFAQLSAESANGVQESGVNFGTIRYRNALNGSFLGTVSNWIVIDPTKKVPDISINVAVNAPGTYTLAIDAATNSGGTVAYTASVDGVQVSSGNLPSGNIFTTAPGQAFSTSVTFATAGNHTVTFHVNNTSRADWVGIYQARLT